MLWLHVTAEGHRCVCVSMLRGEDMDQGALNSSTKRHRRKNRILLRVRSGDRTAFVALPVGKA